MIAQSKSEFYKSDSITIKKNSIALLLGYNFMTEKNLEIGISHYTLDRRNYIHPISKTYFLSAEINTSDKLILGPKIGVIYAGGVAGTALGMSLIYYTDSQNETLRLRPEIGFGIGLFTCTYGYNIPLINSNFENINTHNISLKLNLPIWKIRDKKIKNKWKEKT